MQYTLSISDRTNHIYKEHGFLDGKKVAVIKALRGVTNLGLKQAKELSEDFDRHNVSLEERTDLNENREQYIADGIEVLRGLGINVTKVVDPTTHLLKEAARVALDNDNTRLAIQILNLVEQYS